MERSAMREGPHPGAAFPDCASLHPGYYRDLDREKH
jgi:hypothetical protein